MRLLTYLKIHSLTRTEFAKLVGCSHVTISQIVNGETQPRMELAETIEKVTRGSVSVEELCYDPGAGPIGLAKVRATEGSEGSSSNPSREEQTS